MEDFIKEEILSNGWYPKPRYLIQMVKYGKLTKSEYILLDLLFHLENCFTAMPYKWFYHTDKALCATGLISPKTLIRARRTLRDKGHIDFKSGYTGRATEYKILIEGRKNKKNYYLISKYNKKALRRIKQECLINAV